MEASDLAAPKSPWLGVDQDKQDWLAKHERAADAPPAESDASRALQRGRGRAAVRPSEIPSLGWKDFAYRVFGDRDSEYLMIDSSIVRAHAQAATGQKGGSATRLWGAPEAD